jgi:septation ring formation regulator EzrA
MNLNENAGQWVVGLVAMGLVASFTFLVKKAFNDFGEQLKEMMKKLDEIKEAIAKHDTRIVVLENDLRGVKEEIELLRQRYHDIANAVTAIQAMEINRHPTGSYSKVP